MVSFDIFSAKVKIIKSRKTHWLCQCSLLTNWLYRKCVIFGIKTVVTLKLVQQYFFPRFLFEIWRIFIKSSTKSLLLRYIDWSTECLFSKYHFVYGIELHWCKVRGRLFWYQIFIRRLQTFSRKSFDENLFLMLELLTVFFISMVFHDFFINISLMSLDPASWHVNDFGEIEAGCSEVTAHYQKTTLK